MASVSEDVAPVQRRTLRLLFGTQILGGMGTAIGIAVGGLLAARLGGTAVSGFASSSMVVGAALLAVPVSKIMSRYGRRPGLGFAYLAGTLGAVVVVLATARGSVPLLFVGMAAFGGGPRPTSRPATRPSTWRRRTAAGAHLSLVVWATTLGAVAAPELRRRRRLGGHGPRAARAGRSVRVQRGRVRGGGRPDSRRCCGPTRC